MGQEFDAHAAGHPKVAYSRRWRGNRAKRSPLREHGCRISPQPPGSILPPEEFYSARRVVFQARRDLPNVLRQLLERS